MFLATHPLKFSSEAPKLLFLTTCFFLAMASFGLSASFGQSDQTLTATSELHIILRPDSNPFILPLCKSPAPGVRRIEGGFMGLTFDIPKKDFEILGGKRDTDYVRWAIKLKSSKSFASLWFGPYAFNPEPGDDLLHDSVSITQRDIETPDRERVGKDSFGLLSNGDKWRHFYVAIADGAEYRASAADALLLDRVVNSACQIRSHH